MIASICIAIGGFAVIAASVLVAIDFIRTIESRL